MSNPWTELEQPPRSSVTIAGIEVRRGNRVMLRPGSNGDPLIAAVAGKAATVESIEEDLDGGVHVVVTIDDDPARDLGRSRHPAHRFFFAPDELTPIGDTPPRVLIAGIGNVFMADDGFGVEVARLLQVRPLPAGVEVRDFGIRGMDLAYALGEEWDAVVFLDAAPRGEQPGTLSVIEPRIDEGSVGLVPHAMDPVSVLGLASTLGPVPGCVRVVACEPAVQMTGEEEEVVGELSTAVEAALAPAAELVESVVAELLAALEVERTVER